MPKKEEEKLTSRRLYLNGTHFHPSTTIVAVGLATADSRRPSSYTHSNCIPIPPPQICVDFSDPPLPRSSSSRATIAASSSDLLFRLKLLPTCSCGLGDSELEEPGGRKRWRSSSQLFIVFHIDELDLKIKKYLRGEAASFEDLKDRNLKHQLSVREELYGNATKAAANAEKITTFNISLVVHGTIAENDDFQKEESNPYAVPISMGIFRVLFSPLGITTITIIRRIISNHKAFQKRNEKKEESEKRYYDSKTHVHED
ncbi:hypothetical protein Ahy_A09g043444 [Arachis hypogaea]|uniref:Uncharacterized protein n=1 Tax=Arachis hypogaea TaxID=3818 RepID=A0A445BIB3_ARAHY|nr:hypothetical protein Ahy_A09g043444 [Arachis hypogaea]